MPRILVIAGRRPEDRTALLEKLITALRAAGLRVGVTVHRTISDGQDVSPGEVSRYSHAGAWQVLITRGTDAGLRGKHGGLTPLKRLAARYFNTADFLLAEGYFDPVPVVEVCLSNEADGFQRLADPNLLAIVYRDQPPAAGGRPAFPFSGVEGLAGWLRGELLNPKKT